MLNKSSVASSVISTDRLIIVLVTYNSGYEMFILVWQLSSYCSCLHRYSISHFHRVASSVEYQLGHTADGRLIQSCDCESFDYLQLISLKALMWLNFIHVRECTYWKFIFKYLIRHDFSPNLVFIFDSDDGSTVCILSIDFVDLCCYLYFSDRMFWFIF